MTELRLLLIAILLWGASVLADLPKGDDNLQQDQQSINMRVGLLNATTPGLDLKTRIPADTVVTAEKILSDLYSLNNALQGKEALAPGSLTTLTCERAFCFGDDQ